MRRGTGACASALGTRARTGAAPGGAPSAAGVAAGAGAACLNSPRAPRSPSNTCAEEGHPEVNALHVAHRTG